MNEESSLLELSRAAALGDSDAITRIASQLYDDEPARDLERYRWCVIAQDRGHDVTAALFDLLETSTLRYDDEEYARGSVHFELGCAYLTGEPWVDVDLRLADRHLEVAAGVGYPASLDGGEELVAGVGAGLSGEALAVFTKHF